MTVVQRVARDWLAGIDRGDFEASWRTSGARFRGDTTAERWIATAKRMREPLGAVVRRSGLRTSFARQFRGAPPGEYGLVAFRTEFAKGGEHQENVTLEHEPDGAWRVIGYLVR